MLAVSVGRMCQEERGTGWKTTICNPDRLKQRETKVCDGALGPWDECIGYCDCQLLYCPYRTRFWPGQVFWIAGMFVWISFNLCLTVFNINDIFWNSAFFFADLARSFSTDWHLLGIFLSAALRLGPLKRVSFSPPHKDHDGFIWSYIRRCSQLCSHSSGWTHTS